MPKINLGMILKLLDLSGDVDEEIDLYLAGQLRDMFVYIGFALDLNVVGPRLAGLRKCARKAFNHVKGSGTPSIEDVADDYGVNVP